MSLLKTTYCLSTTMFARLGYTENYVFIKYHKSFLHKFKTFNSINYTTKYPYYVISFCNKDEFIQRSMLIPCKKSLCQYTITSRKNHDSSLVKDSNMFGDLSNEKYRRIKMNTLEEIEETLADNGPVLNRQRTSTNEYSKLIEFHLDRKDLDSALSVLDLVKQNNSRPKLRFYKLLISEYAAQGDMRTCFKLFRKMKDYGIIPTLSIYNSLINACAETTNKTEALTRLKFIREYFNARNINFSNIHYTTLVKAYSRHQEVLSAFEIADEARDKGLCTKGVIATLFHATISDKEKGLKLALCLWHKMRISGIQPNIIHYNLLLRAIRDTMLGDLKVHDMLVPNSQETQIQLSETDRPDLLAHPPVLNTSLILELNKQPSDTVNASNTELCVADKAKLTSEYLNGILQRNRIILFGGVEMLLKHMESDGVLPNVKTVSIMLTLLPPTLNSENYFLKCIKQLKIKLDITFFNILIKRRCKRRQYNHAIGILNEVQFHNLTPDIFTFSALAVGCIRHRDGIELLEQMHVIGYTPNDIILQTLLNNACHYKNVNYVLHLMNYLLHNKIQLSTELLSIFDEFDRLLLEPLKQKGKYSYTEIRDKRKNYNKFKLKYLILKKKLKNKPGIEMSKSSNN